MKIFLYAVVSIPSGAPGMQSILSELSGMHGESLFPVSVSDIAVIVGHAGVEELTVKEKAIAFAAVIEKLQDRFTLLPMRLGSEMDSIEAVSGMIDRNYSGFVKNLKQVKGRCEFGLKVFCDQAKLEMEFKSTKSIEDPQMINTQLIRSDIADYLNKKLEHHRIEENILNFTRTIVDQINALLAEVAAAPKFNKVVSANLLVDSVFLLDKGSEALLIDSVSMMQEKYPALNFFLTGPWPPYSFVDITIR